MATIEVAGIAAVKVLHASRQVWLGRLHEEMVVISHQRKSVQPPTVGFDGPSQPVEPFLPVHIIQDDVLPGIPSGHDMINRTPEFDSQRSCRDPILPSVGLQGNRYSLFKL